MSSIDNRELFEQYYQSEYDFNTASLSQEEIAEIKVLAREKRGDYGLAPMGTNVFDWIRKQNSDIRFELVSFESEKIDGMLYIPTTGKERALQKIRGACRKREKRNFRRQAREIPVL